MNVRIMMEATVEATRDRGEMTVALTVEEVMTTRVMQEEETMLG